MGYSNAPVTELVDDPTQAIRDDGLPAMSLALTPSIVEREIRKGLKTVLSAQSRLEVRRISVLRHKLQRRCVVQYDLSLCSNDGPIEILSIIGKVRARRFGKEGYRRARALWDQGFTTSSPDGISVPEPLGTVSSFRMWLQRRVPGTTLTEILSGPHSPLAVARVSDAAFKLHQTNLTPSRTHTLKDELDVLRKSLPVVVQRFPQWENRIGRVLELCERLAGCVPLPTRTCPIHRDFYSDQLIVDGERIYMLDFDMLCCGDPALDMGNFLGHVSELGLRRYGCDAALQEVENAIADRYCLLAGEYLRPVIDAYKTLTLVRHIYLSTQFLDRRHLTDQLLSLCERRLDPNYAQK